MTGSASAALPADYDPTDWHSLALEVRGGTAWAELTHARLGDPVARGDPGPAGRHEQHRAGGAYARGAGVRVDNLSALRAATPVSQQIPLPTPGRLLTDSSDEFDGAALAPGWQVVRDPAVTVEGGSLVWPVESKDLTGPGGNAGLLLRDAPDGQLDGRDEADHRPRHGHGAQLPAGRPDRLRGRRPVRPPLARRDLEHPPDRVRQGDALRRPDLSYGGTIDRPTCGDDVAAAGPPPRPRER